MTGSELKEHLNDKGESAEYLCGWKDKKIRRLTFFDDADFGSGINLYFMSKKDFSSAAEAFCAAWMNQYLWEEDIEKYFDFSHEKADAVRDGAFAEDIARYVYRDIDAEAAKRYINKALRPIAEKARLAGEDESDGKDEFLSRSGVYVDRKFTLKNSYILKTGENIKDAVLLYRSSGSKLQTGCEMFFETDNKYAFYLE